jgi:hypothetical protein
MRTQGAAMLAQDVAVLAQDVAVLAQCTGESPSVLHFSAAW